jgi:hypothetical protein
VAADAYYSKVKFINAVCAADLDIVGKLRGDAHLRWPYPGPYGGTGRPRKYAGKVDLHTERDRLEAHGELLAGIEAYSAIVWVKAFKRQVKRVL